MVDFGELGYYVASLSLILFCFIFGPERGTPKEVVLSRPIFRGASQNVDEALIPSGPMCAGALDQQSEEKRAAGPRSV
jgi:hypothetical protein